MYRRLEAVGVCKSYKTREVVKSVSLHVDRGEVIGLLGPMEQAKQPALI